MKKYLFLFAIFGLVALGSCKSEAKDRNPDESKLQKEIDSKFKTISGEFIYTDSVAVFKKRDGIYGVVMNDQAKDLISQAKEMNSDPFASFDVTLKVDIRKNTEEDAWPEVIDIQNTIKVKPSSKDDSLKLDK